MHSQCKKKRMQQPAPALVLPRSPMASIILKLTRFGRVGSGKNSDHSANRVKVSRWGDREPRDHSEVQRSRVGQSKTRTVIKLLENMVPLGSGSKLVALAFGERFPFVEHWLSMFTKMTLEYTNIQCNNYKLYNLLDSILSFTVFFCSYFRLWTWITKETGTERRWAPSRMTCQIPVSFPSLPYGVSLFFSNVWL